MESKIYRLIQAEQGIDERFDSESKLIEALAERYDYLDINHDDVLTLVGFDGNWFSIAKYQILAAVDSYKFELREEIALERISQRMDNNHLVAQWL